MSLSGEGTSNFSNYVEEVESIGNITNVPEWAKMLIGCVKNLINEIKSLNTINLEKISKLEDKTNVQDTVSKRLGEENERLRGEIELLKKAVDHNEQVSRSSNLLIHGVPEENNESTDNLCVSIIKDKLEVDVSINEISRSHRLGPPRIKMNTRNAKPFCRPIIVKFSNIRKRLEVFHSKRKLKGSNISVTENLTQQRYKLYKEAMTKLGKHNVWTSDGRILTKTGNSFFHISSREDLESL